MCWIVPSSFFCLSVCFYDGSVLGLGLFVCGGGEGVFMSFGANAKI